MNANIPVTSAGTGSLESLDRALATHPFMRELSPHATRLLRDFAMPARFTTDEILFREGDPANRFYLLQSGSVALESFGISKGRVLIQTVHGGDVLGWSWLFPPYIWHFDARAIEHTEALFIYGAPLREECENDHELGYELFKRMSQLMLRRLQATRRHILGLDAPPL